MSKKPAIAILGCGPQGRAWTNNLRDSGCDITIGLSARSKSKRATIKDKIKPVTSIAGAVKKADIVIFAFPDHLHGRAFEKDIGPNLKGGAAMVFLCGFSIHFKTVIPPEDCDVILLAPLGPGAAVREAYLKKKPIGFFHAVHQNGTGGAKQILNYLIQNLRLDKKALIKTTFRDEAIGDIFGEQAVLCGGLSQLIKSGYETLTEAGLSSDKAYLEVAYQLDLIVDMIRKYGIEGMFKKISVMAQYGSLLSGPKIIDRAVKKRMKETLHRIENGIFAKELNSLTPARLKKLRSDLKKLSSWSFEKSARKFSGG